MKKFFLAALTLLALSFGVQQAVSAKAPSDKVIRILAIGNSFSEDSVEQNFWQIANDAGVPVIVANMYIGGCSIDRHFKNITGDIPEYRYCKIMPDGTKTRTKSTERLSMAIKDEPWDFVTIQQVSQEAGQPDSYTHLQEVVDWIRANAPDAEVVFHQTWAYGPKSGHGGFAKYGWNQRTMYARVVEVTREQARKVGIKRIIPTGTALQDARTTSLGNDLTRDGFHMSKGFGRYLAACTWFEALMGINVTRSTYVPDGSEAGTEAITPEEAIIARRAAHQAVKAPFCIVPIKEKKK